MSKQILNRRDTAANWTSINPVLGPGEIGVESDGDNPRFKLGDGVSTWSQLEYFGAGSGGGSEVAGNVTTYTVGPPESNADFNTWIDLFEFLNENRNASATTRDETGSWPVLEPTEIVIDGLNYFHDLNESEGEPELTLYGFNTPITFKNARMANAYFYFRDCAVTFLGDFAFQGYCYMEFYNCLFYDGGSGQPNGQFRWGTDGSDLAFYQNSIALLLSNSQPNGLWVTFYEMASGTLRFTSEGTNTAALNIYDHSDVRVIGDLAVQQNFGALDVSYGSRLSVEGNLTVRSASLSIDENSELLVHGDLTYLNLGSSIEYLAAFANSDIKVSGTLTLPANADTGPVANLSVRLNSTLSCLEALAGDGGDITVDSSSSLSVAQKVDTRAISSYIHTGILPDEYDFNQDSPGAMLWSDNGVLVTNRYGVDDAVDRHLRFDEFSGSGLILAKNFSDYYWTQPFDNADIDAHLNQPDADPLQILSWNGTDYEWVNPSAQGGYGDADVDIHLNTTGASDNTTLVWNGTDYEWVAPIDIGYGDDDVRALLNTGTSAVDKVLSWDGTNFVWVLRDEPTVPTGDDAILALVDFDVATVPEITDKSNYGNEILYYLSSGDLASRFPDALLTEYAAKFGSGSLAVEFDPFGLPVSCGPGDFCVEFWLRRDQFTGNVPIWSVSDPGGDNVILSLYLQTSTSFPYSGKLGISALRSDGSTSWGTVYGTANVSYTQWTHVAFYRLGETLYLGINGNVDAIVTGDRALADMSLTSEMAFGNRHPTHPFFDGNDRLRGGFDDIRITVGDAVPYPAGVVGDTFDIPTEAHPAPSGGGGGGNDARISDTQITNWDTAYGWGDHSTAGYLTEFTEADPTVPQHVKDITEAQITAWDSGTGGGGAVDSVNGQTGEVTITAADLGALETEADPTVPQHVKDITQAEIDAWNAGGGGGNDSRISNQQITDWDEAHGWGDHAQAGYLTDFTEADPTVPTWVKSITQADIDAWNAGGGDDSRITNQQIIDWDTAYGWGDHSQAGYLTDFTESDPTVPSWVKSITQEDIDAWNADPAAQTIVEIGAEPTSPTQGDLWLNDATSTVYIYDAGNWLQFPIGEAGEVTSAQVILGEGSSLVRLEGSENLVTQADANKFIEAELETLHTRMDTENNSLWEETDTGQVIRPADNKNITSSSAVFGALQTGTMAASTAAFTTVTVAGTIQAEDFLDEDGNSLIERSNALDVLLQAEIAALVKELQAASEELAGVVAKYDEQFASMEAALLALDSSEQAGEAAGTLNWVFGSWTAGQLTDATVNQFKMHSDFTSVVMNHDTINAGRKNWPVLLEPYPHTVGLKLGDKLYYMVVEYAGNAGTNARGKNFNVLEHNIPSTFEGGEVVEIYPDYKPASTPVPDRIDGGSY